MARLIRGYDPDIEDALRKELGLPPRGPDDEAETAMIKGVIEKLQAELDRLKPEPEDDGSHGAERATERLQEAWSKTGRSNHGRKR